MLDAGHARTVRQRMGLHETAAQSLAPTKSLIVAPLVTNQGTVVFARIDGAVETLFLDDLKGSEVARQIASDQDSHPGWLQKYEAAHDPFGGDEGTRRRLWSNDVAEMADWLGLHFVQPITAWLATKSVPTDRAIVWSLQGELAILPFGAATLADGTPLVATRPSSLTPSEYFLGIHQSLASAPLLSVANPTGDSKLAFAALETADLPLDRRTRWVSRSCAARLVRA